MPELMETMGVEYIRPNDVIVNVGTVVAVGIFGAFYIVAVRERHASLADGSIRSYVVDHVWHVSTELTIMAR